MKKDYQNHTKSVNRDIVKRIAQGLYRDVDPDLLANILTGQVEIMALRMLFNNKYTFEEMQNFVRDFGMYGLSPSSSSGTAAEDSQS